MKKIWVDTDPGVDDTVAMAMLFESKQQVELVGVSTVFGNTDVEGTTRDALRELTGEKVQARLRKKKL